MSRLLDKYQKELIPNLKKELGLENQFSVPRLKKVVLNIGIKEIAHDDALLTKTSERLAVISGQKPRLNRAKKSIAGFKLGKGEPIGFMVTLRGKRMYDFLDKIFTIVLPRVRDFKGVSESSFDGRGNYNLGIEDQVVFPEIEFERAERARGLEITIVTTAKENESAKKLLESLGMPFMS